MLRRQVIAGVVLTCLLSAASETICADGNLRPANSYPSELWRMEFRNQKQKNADIEASIPQSTGASDAGKGSVGSSMMSLTGPALLESLPAIEDVVPGQAGLTEIQAETPFAEWAVDKAAQGENEKQNTSASAWTLSKTAGGSSLTSEEVLSEGPSAITFLVAGVAAMVVIGAMFSGRD